MVERMRATASRRKVPVPAAGSRISTRGWGRAAPGDPATVAVSASPSARAKRARSRRSTLATM